MLSLRRATFVGLAAHRLRNISIHALLAESDADNGDAGNGCDAISIHALLAESDYWLPVRHSRTENFYPRSPCGERPQAIYPCVTPPKFLSTLSLRRATVTPPSYNLRIHHISIHALLAESDGRNGHNVNGEHKISIHALLAESDLVNGADLLNCFGISIHALLAESDRHRAAPTRPGWHFYPRSPCGERPHCPGKQ